MRDGIGQAERVAVIGGSFNPVTRAHVELGRIVKTQLGEGCRVLYIPAPDGFLASWKEMRTADILSGEQRLRLLQTAVEPEGFACDDCELTGKTSGRTYDTFCYLRKRYGEAVQLYYVCGSDKLPELPIWYQAGRLLETVRILVVPRDDDDPEQMIRECPFLREHADCFTVSHTVRQYPDFSSTQVRESLKEGTDDWKDMVPEAVWKELRGMVDKQCH